MVSELLDSWLLEDLAEVADDEGMFGDWLGCEETETGLGYCRGGYSG